MLRSARSGSEPATPVSSFPQPWVAAASAMRQHGARLWAAATPVAWPPGSVDASNRAAPQDGAGPTSRPQAKDTPYLISGSGSGSGLGAPGSLRNRPLP